MIKDSSYYKIPNTNRYEVYLNLERDDFMKLLQTSRQIGVDAEELATKIVCSYFS